MLYAHVLKGCRSTPLSSYLKSLGVLRIVAEQRDPEAKGHWEDGCFVLATSLTADDLERFFVQEYCPSPILAPWNGGSGFYPGDNTEALDRLVGSQDKRFDSYRSVIKEVQSWDEVPKPLERVGDVIRVLTAEYDSLRPGKKRDDVRGLLDNIENSTPSEGMPNGLSPQGVKLANLEVLAKTKARPDESSWKPWWNAVKKGRTRCTGSERSASKELILAACRSRLPQTCLDWLDAVCALHPDRGPLFNPVLGTGGNEGRLDFSNNYMQNVVSLFIESGTERTRQLLQASLYNAVLSGLPYGKAGHFDPGRAGGFNQGAEVETKEFKINPWDFVLMFEGTLVLAGSLVRRSHAGQNYSLSSPFTVRFSAVGFTSSEYTEGGRMETWLPLWAKLATFREVKHLFGEGRSEVGKRKAQSGLDFSRALGTLGVDRGIEAFERFAFLERRGKSYVALHAGRLSTKYSPNIELLDEVDLLTTPLDRFLREFKNPPATFISARRQIDEAIFVCTRQPDPRAFSELVRALGRMEKLLAFRDRSKKPALARPLYGLSPRWVMLADAGGPEVRIAAAIASIRNTGKVGSIRSNLADTDPLSASRWATQGRQQHWVGNSLAERLGGVLVRRLVDAEKYRAGAMPIESEIALSPHDAMPFLWGKTDDAILEELLWGFSVINWRKPGLRAAQQRFRKPLTEYPLSRSWALLKLLHMPGPIRGVLIRSEQRISRLLAAGRIQEGIEVALHRLRVSELHPFAVDYSDELQADRLLASLLIPINAQWTIESLVLKDKSQSP
jgi:CRISPR-associated protein Csx17